MGFNIPRFLDCSNLSLKNILLLMVKPVSLIHVLISYVYGYIVMVLF